MFLRSGNNLNRKFYQEKKPKTKIFGHMEHTHTQRKIEPNSVTAFMNGRVLSFDISNEVFWEKKNIARENEREKSTTSQQQNLIVTSSLFTRCKYVKEFAVFFF